jgi:hypothetical protein
MMCDVIVSFDVVCLSIHRACFRCSRSNPSEGSCCLKLSSADVDESFKFSLLSISINKVLSFASIHLHNLESGR